MVDRLRSAGACMTVDIERTTGYQDRLDMGFP